MTVDDWKTKADAFKQRILHNIPPEWVIIGANHLGTNVANLTDLCPMFSEREREITALDATALRDAIAARRYTSVEVTRAYGKAAALIHQVTNCLSDYFLEEALERAAWLDAELERTGMPVGPLHGVPVSVKDPINLKGHPSTAGFVSWIDNVPEEDGTVPAILRAAGAVFYVKTHTPQAIMIIETESFLGTTVNPHNRKLTSGGSSGGEAALLASDGAALGLGTDIGGSVRNPSACCGIYGMRPTAGRIPNGLATAVDGEESILSSTGPMARSARDITLFMTTVLNAEPWKLDANVPRMPWRPAEVEWLGGSRPRIGIMWDDGVVRPQPPMARALKTAADKLKAAGLDVVDYAPYRTNDAVAILTALFFTDGGEAVRKALDASGEPIHPAIESLLAMSKKLPHQEVWDLIVKRDKFRNDYLKHWNDSHVDVVLCPPSIGPAQVVGTTRYIAYTGIWNVVDYPGVVFPTGLRVEETVDVVEQPTDFLSASDKDVWKLYDSPKTFENAPLSLQIVGPRWEDEKVLKALDIITKIVQVRK